MVVAVQTRDQTALLIDGDERRQRRIHSERGGERLQLVFGCRDVGPHQDESAQARFHVRPERARIGPRHVSHHTVDACSPTGIAFTRAVARSTNLSAPVLDSVAEGVRGAVVAVIEADAADEAQSPTAAASASAPAARPRCRDFTRIGAVQGSSAGEGLGDRHRGVGVAVPEADRPADRARLVEGGCDHGRDVGA